jgi:hypothetical protein
MRLTLLASILALPLAAACDSTPTGEEDPSQRSSIFGVSGDSAELNVVADEMEGGVNQDPFVQDPMMPQ